MPANILIAGDLCPINKNEPLLIAGNSNGLFGDLISVFDQMDLCMANLEAPLVEKPSPIQKIGPVLGADVKVAEGIKNAGFEVLNLANNHIFDHGSNGVISTLRACQNAKIKTVGGGMSLGEASKCLIQDIGALRIGVLGFAEIEFSVASESRPGANPLNEIHCYRSIREAAGKVDYLITLVHAGPAYYPYPTPWLQQVCRFFVELGSRAVICQHSHCAGCYEVYNNGLIVYGQGDFVFDWHLKPEHPHQQGFLIQLQAEKDCEPVFTLLPFKQSSNFPGVRALSGSEKNEFINDIRARSEGIKSTTHVRSLWHNYCHSKTKDYLARLLSGTPEWKVLRILSRYLLIHKFTLTQRRLLGLENLIACQTHREVIETLLRDINRGDLSI